MNPHARTVCAWGLLIAAPAVLQAQRPDSVPSPVVLAALSRTRLHTPIRLRLVTGAHFGGPLISVDSTTLVLGPYIGYSTVPTTLRPAMIDSLWVRGTRSRQGLLYGAAAGLLLGAAIGNLETSFCPGANAGCPGDRIAGAAVGAVILGGTGWLVGSSLPHWKRVFPPRTRRHRPPRLRD